MADETKPQEQIEEVQETHRQMIERLDREQKEDPTKLLEEGEKPNAE